MLFRVVVLESGLLLHILTILFMRTINERRLLRI